MNLDSLFNPRSIAVIGASERPSAGRAILGSLMRMGYEGAFYPVNPRYESVLGQRCHASIEALPREIDAAVFCIGNARLLESYRAAIDRGMRGAVVFSAGFSEAHTQEGDALSRELKGMSLEAGVAMLGPNCMGVLNPATASSMYMHEVFDPERLAGNVGFMSQSGSICIAMLADCRRYGFSHAISTGNEEIVSSCDVLEALIDDPTTRVIASFTESVREPERFVALLDRAADRGKPVVVLKVGKTARAQRAILSHTGGLAGESRTFSAMLRAHRAIEVDDLGAMAEVLALCQGAKWPKGKRLAVVTGSGGQTELLLDISSRTPIDLPALGTEERATVEQVVGHVSGDGNPLDAWGNGNPNENYPWALRTLGNSNAFDAVAFCGDGMDGHPLDDPAEDLLYAQMVANAAVSTQLPLVFFSTRSGVFRSDQEEVVRQAGVALLSGAREGMMALAKMADWAQPVPAAREAPTGEIIAIDSSRASINEFDAKRLIEQTGVPSVPERMVQSLAEAVDAAGVIGYPVVLKVAADSIPHKTEHRLLELDLADEMALKDAWSLIQSRIASMSPVPVIEGLVVQKMVKGGLEFLIGVKRDADFGPMLVLGLGGTLVDLAPEVEVRPLPLRAGDAEHMIEALPIAARLIDGVRGAKPADRAALHACLYAVSDFISRTGDAIAELDLNPVKVMSEGAGCFVVDAVIVPR
jgi:acetate---CoA ligase (ADP-forming)